MKKPACILADSLRAPQLFVAALVAGLFATACTPAEVPPEPVRAVKLMRVGTAPLQSKPAYAGEIKARVESRLGFRVDGKIISREAQPGQRVKAGQVLARLDPQDYQLAVAAARAQSAAAATQRDLARADFKRYEALKAQGFISGAELERRESALEAAQAQVDQAQSQLAVQSNQARYAALVADVSGVVTATLAEVGQVVSSGAPVVSVAADGPRDVVFAVAEDQVASFSLGQPLQAKVWNRPQLLNGKVRELSAAADPMTRTYTVKLALDAGQEAPPLGATVEVSPPAGAQLSGNQVIKLPTTALMKDGAGSAVWVLDAINMRVRSQPVNVATMDGNEAVVASGLAPGDLVVSTGVHVLSPGQKVTAYDPSAVGLPATGSAQAASTAPNPRAN